LYIKVDTRFDDAALEALCVDNAEPSFNEIKAAKERLPGLLTAAANFIYDNPVNSNKYACEQRAFPLIKRMMEKAGWTYCGSGYYSAAFFNKGLAVKIGFKPEDSALMYAAWCRANQGRVGVPVIHQLKAEGTAFIILMDRLSAVAGELEEGTSCYDARLSCELLSIQETMRMGVDGWGKHMEICRTAMDIRDFFEGIAHIDVCPANVMLDRDNNLIITDPVSFVGDYQSILT
jgi:hypothetical protein